MEHNNINPIDPCHGRDDSRVRDGCVLRHLLSARDRSVFDRNMAMMRALGAGEPVTGVARRYGVTRQWLHALRRRHAEQGEPGLLPRSRRPRSVHNCTGDEVRALIVQVRERLLAGGRDHGARSIHGVLAQRMGRAVRLHDPPHPSGHGPGRGRTQETAAQLVCQVRGRAAQRDVAVGFHALAAGRRHGRADPHLARRPLAHGAPVARHGVGDRRARGPHVPRMLRRARHARLDAHRQRLRLHQQAHRGRQGARACSNASWPSTACARRTAGQATPPRRARSNAGTAPSSNGSAPGRAPATSPNCRTSSTSSSTPTTGAATPRLPASAPSRRTGRVTGPAPTRKGAAAALSECDIDRRLRQGGHARRPAARRATVRDPGLDTAPERSTVRRDGTVNHHCLGRSWQLYIGSQYAGSQVETMVIDGDAVAVLTGTGEIIHDQPFDTNNHYQCKGTNTPPKRRPHVKHVSRHTSTMSRHITATDFTVWSGNHWKMAVLEVGNGWTAHCP